MHLFRVSAPIDIVQLLAIRGRIITIGVLSLIFQLFHDIVQAIADAAAPIDRVYLKSANPDLEVYRSSTFKTLASRLARVEEQLAILDQKTTSSEITPEVETVSSLTTAQSKEDEFQAVMEGLRQHQAEGAAAGDDDSIPEITPDMEATLRAAIFDDRDDSPPTPAKKMFRHMRAHTKARTFPVAFQGTCKAGTTITVQVQPQVLFRGCKLMAIDDSDEPGKSTAVAGCFVGNRLVMQAFGRSIPTSEFAYDQCNNEMLWPTCDPALYITFQISATKDCTWYAVLFGEAVF